ncbi:AvrD family protein, partial [Brevibacterium luteolum]|uniref:AvrD family protein n=1 Tax=Brevibacterium luteolum TaxID=199591 RepID=UPI00223A85E6
MKDFDEILGDSDKRYLSNGYRNVSHAVTLHRPLGCRVYQSRDVQDVDVSVVYPTHWSSKPGGQIDPHLSSFDAMILG